MSKFIDRLKQVSQTAPQPIGFARTQPASARPRIQLVASVAEGDIDNLADYVTGADATLLRVSKLDSDAILQKISQAMSEISWGVWLGDSTQVKIEQIVEHGSDFVVFSAATTSLAIPQDNKLGKVLQVESSLSEGLLRAVNRLPVDAVLITDQPEEKHPLTWYQLMLFQRSASLLTKPLLVSIPSAVTANELQAIWDAGVDGVVVEVGTGQPAAELKSLRQAIDQLTFPTPHHQEKREALLPRTETDSGKVAEPEEEDDEEEEFDTLVSGA